MKIPRCYGMLQYRIRPWYLCITEYSCEWTNLHPQGSYCLWVLSVHESSKVMWSLSIVWKNSRNSAFVPVRYIAVASYRSHGATFVCLYFVKVLPSCDRVWSLSVVWKNSCYSCFVPMRDVCSYCKLEAMHVYLYVFGLWKFNGGWVDVYYMYVLTVVPVWLYIAWCTCMFWILCKWAGLVYIHPCMDELLVFQTFTGMWFQFCSLTIAVWHCSMHSVGMRQRACILLVHGFSIRRCCYSKTPWPI